MVTAPNPNERIRQGLLKDAAITVTRGEAEDEAVGVTLRREGSLGAFAGHHPVVVRFFGIIRSIIIFGNVRENTKRLLLAVLDQLHARMIFPGAERIFGFLGSVVILLINEGA